MMDKGILWGDLILLWLTEREIVYFLCFIGNVLRKESWISNTGLDAVLESLMTPMQLFTGKVCFSDLIQKGGKRNMIHLYYLIWLILIICKAAVYTSSYFVNVSED